MSMVRGASDEGEGLTREIEAAWATFDQARAAADRRLELDRIAAGTERDRNRAIRRYERALDKAQKELDLAHGIE